eukprot:EG_transcript_26863
MALTSHAPYLACIRKTLEAALCIQNFPSQVVERHNKPEVEAQTSPELLLNPIVIAKEPNEKVLIESSINSVRVSIKIRQSDDAEKALTAQFMSFLTRRAEQFIILRRKPVEGYDLSFLIINDHVEVMMRHKLIDFVINFMQEIDREIKDMKLGVNARARLVAKEFLAGFG